MKYQEITAFRNLELYCLKKKAREKNHCWVLTLPKRENVCGEWGAFLLYFLAHITLSILQLLIFYKPFPSIYLFSQGLCNHQYGFKQMQNHKGICLLRKGEKRTNFVKKGHLEVIQSKFQLKEGLSLTQYQVTQKQVLEHQASTFNLKTRELCFHKFLSCGGQMMSSQSSSRVAKALPERAVRSGNNWAFLGGNKFVPPTTLSL